MGQVAVTRRYRFCAAHRLHTDRLSAEENRAAFGKCNNVNGHGHNYVVLVTVTNSTSSGGAVDLDRLDEVVTDTIMKRWDHQDLNRDLEFSDRTTTGENLVLLMWDLLVDKFPPGTLAKVGVIETRDNYFEYAASTAAHR
jgi:6-pyruvoyltetrahydropterin/6-carboxytetrahydropterin synthase